MSTTRFMEILPVRYTNSNAMSRVIYCHFTFRLHPVLDYITSPGIIIPTLVLLILTIWYLWSLTSMLRCERVHYRVSQKNVTRFYFIDDPHSMHYALMHNGK